MLRFTIRDLLWLMVVVGMGLSLYEQRSQIARQRVQIQQQDSKLREQDFRNGRLSEKFANQDVAMKRLQAAQKQPAKTAVP
jgi:hypothetical protein